jgi:hypothetical protein
MGDVPVGAGFEGVLPQNFQEIADLLQEIGDLYGVHRALEEHPC